MEFRCHYQPIICHTQVQLAKSGANCEDGNKFKKCVISGSIGVRRKKDLTFIILTVMLIDVKTTAYNYKYKL